MALVSRCCSAVAMLATLTISSNIGFAQTSVWRTTSIGGSGGSPYELACPAGSVMIGLRARHGAWIDALAPICSVWVRNSNMLGEIGNQPFAGGNGGGPGFIRCAGPRGVVVGLDIHQANNRDGSVGHITVSCGDYEQPQQFANKLAGSLDFLGQSQRGSRSTVHCGPGVAAGIYGKSGAFVDRLGLLCTRSTALPAKSLRSVRPKTVGQR